MRTRRRKLSLREQIKGVSERWFLRPLSEGRDNLTRLRPASLIC